MNKTKSVVCVCRLEVSHVKTRSLLVKTRSLSFRPSRQSGACCQFACLKRSSLDDLEEKQCVLFAIVKLIFPQNIFTVISHLGFYALFILLYTPASKCALLPLSLCCPQLVMSPVSMFPAAPHGIVSCLYVP